MTAISTSFEHAAPTRDQDETPETAAAPAAPLAAAPHDVQPSAPRSSKALWAGRTLSGLAVLFLGFDAAGKLLQPPQVVEGTTSLGYPASVIFSLGVVQLACLFFYLVPRTAVLGAVLWTGYLGGAIATHVRVGNPLFTHTLFPIYIAALLWGGLWLRDHTLRAVLPLRAAK
ncbi:membrane protein [Sorangium cellulosum]|uniref:Membrane protein n=1 Tax=Sorangium cellulosum TaxID=56 RepID=A0A4V0ND47_SORCE|nr:DoxX family protein [Sorangium cellulosum]AUX21412.1 membrane protein [Sorangium cellulosum]